MRTGHSAEVGRVWIKQKNGVKEDKALWMMYGVGANRDV